MNASMTLRRLGFNPTCEARLVQEVRGFAEKGGRAFCSKLIHALTGEVPVMPAQEKQCVHLAQKVVISYFKDQNSKTILSDSMAHVKKIGEAPRNQYWFAKKEDASVVTKVFSEDAGVAVAVKADGQIKKGGKQQMVEALYEKYIMNGDKATTRPLMIALIAKETGMSPAGASTYFANAKAKFGDPKNLIQSARGKAAE